MRLSIITPAYNVEKYITRCLDSIFCQNFNEKEFEVIVVNDGSTDRTKERILEYANKHSNLQLINQKNQGASVARNTALKLAKGDLIWYVDSDDAVTDESLKTVIEEYDSFPNADFLIFDRIYIDETKNIYRQSCSYTKKKWGFRLKKKNNLYNKPLCRDEAAFRLNGLVPWVFVFKREFLLNHNLFFLPNIVGEDHEMIMRLFFFSKETRFIPFAHYKYTASRPGSVTTETNIDDIKYTNSNLKTIESWNKFYNQYAITKGDKMFISHFLHTKYASLLNARYATKNSEVHNIYLNNRKKWIKQYFITFINSTSINNIFSIRTIKFVLTLINPKIISIIIAKISKL